MLQREDHKRTALGGQASGKQHKLGKYLMKEALRLVM